MHVHLTSLDNSSETATVATAAASLCEDSAMGKKKSFIDKKNAKTYTLVFRSTDDKEVNEEDSDGVLVPADGSTGAAAAAAAAAANRDEPPTRDPRELFAHFFGVDDEDEHKENIPEARRKEMLEHGFPDDGYDYLKHCRVLGRGTSSLQHHAGSRAASQQQHQPQQDAACTSSSAAHDSAVVEPAAAGAGPSVFVRAPRMQAPTADVKLVDARQVHVAGSYSLVGANASATDPCSGQQRLGFGTHAGEGFVSAAARIVQVESEAAAPAAARKLGGRELAEELLELEQLLDAAEGASDTEAAGEQGVGDLLDDFVLEAAAGTDSDADSHQQHQLHHNQLGVSNGAAAAAAHSRRGLPEAADMQDHSSDLSDSTPAQQPKQQQQQPGPSLHCDGSQGDPYSLLNGQFDSLLSAYDDEDLGDLEGDRRAAGHMPTRQLAALVGVDADSVDPDCEGHSVREEDGGVCEEDDYFPSGSEDDIPEDLAALVAARAAAGQKRGVAKKLKQRSPLFEPKVASLDEHDEAVIAAVKARIKAQDDAAGTTSSRTGTGILEDEELQTVYLPSARERWDCESVLSLRSNVSHYPARITSEAARSRHIIAAADPGSSAAAAGGVIKLNAKTGMPVGYSSAGMMAAAAAAAAAAASASVVGADSCSGAQTRLTQQAVAAAAAASGDGDGSVPAYAPSTATSIFERPKHETAEERKARKTAVKDMQREARAVKKQLKQMYAQEAGKQQRQQAGAAKGTVYAIL